MSGIYGSTLIHFSEQFIDIVTFTQVARVGSGYDIVGETKTVRGILQTGKGKAISGTEGRLSQHSGWKTLAVTNYDSIWLENEITLGTYITHPLDGNINIVNKELGWAREAGFFAYSLEKLVGDDGTFAESLPIEGGQF
jgi:hypothetical protein